MTALSAEQTLTIRVVVQSQRMAALSPSTTFVVSAESGNLGVNQSAIFSSKDTAAKYSQTIIAMDKLGKRRIRQLFFFLGVSLPALGENRCTEVNVNGA